LSRCSLDTSRSRRTWTPSWCVSRRRRHRRTDMPRRAVRGEAAISRNSSGQPRRPVRSGRASRKAMAQARHRASSHHPSQGATPRRTHQHDASVYERLDQQLFRLTRPLDLHTGTIARSCGRATWPLESGGMPWPWATPTSGTTRCSGREPRPLPRCLDAWKDASRTAPARSPGGRT
jgi:hypothetical protein